MKPGKAYTKRVTTPRSKDLPLALQFIQSGEGQPGLSVK